MVENSQVSGLQHESERIHDRHSDHGAAEALGVEPSDGPSNDLDTVQLVPVYGSGEPDVRSGGATVDDCDREALLGTGGDPGEW